MSQGRNGKRRNGHKTSGELNRLRQHGHLGTFVSKLTPEVTETIVQAIQRGASIDTACLAAGIARETYHRWIRTGRTALLHPDQAHPDSRPYADFVQIMEAALAEFKLDLTTQIYDAGTDREQWQALGWLAERRFPDEFGRRTRVEHGNADGQPFRVQQVPFIDPSKLTDDELATLIRLAEKAQVGPKGGEPAQLPPPETA